MKEYTVLTINPGSSSTKMGVVKGDKVILNIEVDHHKEDFADCATFADQEPIRTEMILRALKEEGIELSEIDAVSGRGVGLYSSSGNTGDRYQLQTWKAAGCSGIFRKSNADR